MKNTFEELQQKGLPIYFIKDFQEWEAIENIDFKNNDIVEWEVNINLNNEEYILITKKY